MAKALVDEPEEVIVEEFEDEDEQGTMVLELTVAQKDLGKVIGKQGRTAKSMRTILAAAAAKLNMRYVLDIIEEDRDGVRPPSSQSKPSQNQNQDEIENEEANANS